MEKFEAEYSILPEEFLEGYDAVYKLKKQKKTYLKAALFIIPLILFIIQIWDNPYYTLGYVCVAVCVGAMACILLNPSLERKGYERAVEALKDDRYVLKFEGDRLSVATKLPESDREYLEPGADGELKGLPEIPPTVIMFDDKSLSCVEGEKVFTVITKEISLVIPKSGLSEEEQSAVRKAMMGK